MLARFELPERLLFVAKKIQCYFGLTFAVAGAIIGFWGFLVLFGKSGNWFQPDKLVALLRIITGAFAIRVGGHLALSVSPSSRPISDTSLLSTILRTKFRYKPLPKSRMQDIGFRKEQKLNSTVDDNTVNDSTTIHTGGGNYNESISGNYNERISGNYIQGDCITIQGDCISINSDLSEVAAQLLEIVTRLKTQEGYSQEKAQQQVARDLATQAQNKRAVRVKLRKWKRSLDEVTAKTPAFEVATEVVRAASDPETLPDDLRSIETMNYENLECLLKARKWKEADSETLSIIFKPLIEEPEQDFLSSYDISRYILRFPGEDLRYINNLWFKYSQGRFSFSVQKHIWKKVEEDYEAFGDSVGWRVEGDWIYFADIIYSEKAPPGHFPMMVMIISSVSSYHDTMYSAENILHSFVSRQYREY